MKFDGVTYEAEHDEKRLTTQAMKIYKFMSNENWQTLQEISRATNAPEASASACLRDFRKKRWGQHVVERRIRGERKRGLYEYRVMPKGYKTKYEIKERSNKYKDALRAIWNHPHTTRDQKDLITMYVRSSKTHGKYS